MVRDPVTGEARVIKAKQLRKARAAQEALIKSAARSLVEEYLADLRAQLADVAERIEWLEQSRDRRDAGRGAYQ